MTDQPTPRTFTFWVPGDPAPQGSKRNVAKPGEKVRLVEMSKKVKPWRRAVTLAALDTIPGQWRDHRGLVVFSATFQFPRYKSHYRTGRYSDILRADAPVHHLQYPDDDKLIRSTFDALKGVAWHDDAQAAIRDVWKVWCDKDQPAGAHITITQHDD